MGIERTSPEFLREWLDLVLHEKNYVIIRASHALHFLGMRIYPAGRRLNKRNLSKIKRRLTIRNIASYGGLLKQQLNAKRIEAFQWETLETLDNFDHDS